MEEPNQNSPNIRQDISRNGYQQQGPIAAIGSELAAKLQTEVLSINQIAGDGSDRHYFRIVTPQGNRVVMATPVDQGFQPTIKTMDKWLCMAEFLNSNGITVPAVLEIAKDHGLLVIEDFGHRMFQDKINTLIQDGKKGIVLDYYLKGLRVLRNLLQISPEIYRARSTWPEQQFTAEVFMAELTHFQKYSFIENQKTKMTGSHFSKMHMEMIGISEFLAKYSKYFVHRDFHSRNIMLVDNRLGIIDFQDARIGPASYDLVSLCYDPYVRLDFTQRLEITESAIRLLTLGQGNSGDIEKTWRPMTVQRLLKAIGSFYYLSEVKGKKEFSKHISVALRILNHSIFKDSRWPFLTSELPQLLIENLQKRHKYDQ